MATETAQASSATLSPAQLREALRLMLLIRTFDERALALYRAGEMRGTTHPYIGMEAVGVGVMLALRADDWVSSTHRGHGHTIAKGGHLLLWRRRPGAGHPARDDQPGRHLEAAGRLRV